jgi:hypothetical protein
MQQSTTHAGAVSAAPLFRCNGESPRRPWQKAYVYAKRLVSPSAFVTLLDIAELNGDLFPPPVAIRLIANRRGLAMRTIQRHTEELKRANILRIEYSKITWCRNTPNRYIPLDMNGEPIHLIHVRNVVEKLKTELKTTTAPQERRIVPVSRTREGDHPPAMRSLYELNGRLMRSRHNRSSENRQYFAYRANVGVYDPAQSPVHTPPSPEELAERAEYAERERQRQRERVAAAAAAEEQRKREREEYERRRREEMNEKPDAEMQARIDRLNLKLRFHSGD